MFTSARLFDRMVLPNEEILPKPEGIYIMTTITSAVTNEFKINIAVEVLSTEKSKAEIAREYNVSARSVGRWATQFQIDAESIINTKDEAKEIENSVSEKEAKILADYRSNKGQNTDVEDRRFKRGAAPKGVKTIRELILDIMEERVAKGELIKANQKEITKQISDAIGHEYSRCTWYFSVYKKIVGGYQDK